MLLSILYIAFTYKEGKISVLHLSFLVQLFWYPQSISCTKPLCYLSILCENIIYKYLLYLNEQLRGLWKKSQGTEIFIKQL